MQVAGGSLTEQLEQLAWNKSMSSVRVAVEWVFDDVINYFKFLDFKKNLKVHLSAVGKCTYAVLCFKMHIHVYMDQRRVIIFSLTYLF